MIKTYNDAINLLADRVKDNKEALGNSATQRRNQSVDLYGLQITREIGTTIASVKTTIPNQNNSFVSAMLSLVNDTNACYSQSTRWGPCYDCSSSIITALKMAGYDTNGATYTGNMRSALSSVGWEVITSWKVEDLIAGDICLNEVNHTELYIGNGQLAGFHSEATGASVGPYYDYPWDCVLRNTQTANFDDTSGKYDPQSNEGVIASFFIAKGFNQSQVAGIMANIKAESSFNPSAVNPSSGASGLFQWLGERKERLIQFANKEGTNWNDINTQLKYAYNEMTPDGDHDIAIYQWILKNYTYDMFASATDQQTACNVFYNGFERGGVSQIGKRFEYADEIYNNLEGIIKTNTESVGGTATFYISISPDMIYLQRYQFKLAIEKAIGKDFTISIDGYGLEEYFEAQAGKWIDGEGIYPNETIDSTYDILQVASIIKAEADNTSEEAKKQELTEMYQKLIAPGLHQVKISSSQPYVCTMILYNKYLHINR